MQPIFNFGINLILFLQGLGAWLEGPAEFFSFLGREEFFLLVMPALYWCIDTGLGLRVGAVLLISNGLNAILKIIFHGPRPYFYDPQVRALSSETSFGIPSGHAQNAAAVWGALAASLNRWWSWASAILLILLIGLSRIYLGVHFPTDVFFGWVAGACVLWAFLKLEAPLKASLRLQPPLRRIWIVFTLSLLIILLGVIARLSLGTWTIPAAWLQNAGSAAPDAEPLNPLALSGLILVAGAFFGLFSGVILLGERGGFSSKGPLWKRCLRYPVGLTGVVLLWFGLGAIFPRGEYLLAYLLRYLRYALVGFWMSALAPMIFIHLGLAGMGTPGFEKSRPGETHTTSPEKPY